MRLITIAFLLATACGNSVATTEPDAAEVGDAGGEAPDLVHPAGDGAIAEVDAAGPEVDASSPPDAAKPPADLEPACGAEGGPCCNAQLCTTVGQPNGSLCSQGSCGSATDACRVISGAPTCVACGGSLQWCCGTAPICRGVGSTCAGAGSALANHCS